MSWSESMHSCTATSREVHSTTRTNEFCNVWRARDTSEFRIRSWKEDCAVSLVRRSRGRVLNPTNTGIAMGAHSLSVATLVVVGEKKNT